VPWLSKHKTSPLKICLVSLRSSGISLVRTRSVSAQCVTISQYVTNVLVKMNMFRTRCMVLICQDHRVCELRKHFSFLFTPFFEDFSAAQPFLLQQVNNQLVHDFLSQQNNRLFLFLSELMDLFVAGRDQSAADQPNYLAEGHPPL